MSHWMNATMEVAVTKYRTGVRGDFCCGACCAQIQLRPERTLIKTGSPRRSSRHYNPWKGHRFPHPPFLQRLDIFNQTPLPQGRNGQPAFQAVGQMHSPSVSGMPQIRKFSEECREYPNLTSYLYNGQKTATNCDNYPRPS